MRERKREIEIERDGGREIEREKRTFISSLFFKNFRFLNLI